MAKRAGGKPSGKQGQAIDGKLRILICNDDGIDAPGIKVLERIARTLSSDVWVVAPDSEQSAVSHSLTLRRPLRIRKISSRRFAIDGTPTDSVVMALNHIIKDKRPGLLLSGVNRGANLGDDIPYSGTVAATMEGTLLGIPSIAMSQVFRHPHPLKWATAEKHAPTLIRDLLAVGWSKDVLLNINFPDVVAPQVNGVEITRQGRRTLGDLLVDERSDTRGMPYYWIGYRRHLGGYAKGSDFAAIANGKISVTPLQFDRSHAATHRSLRAALK
jgi:5'-nucleotidase